MKISRFHVKGFGRIEDFSIVFSSGLNVIYGSNESGKSTLMAFIKAMLYGLKGGRAGRDGAASPIKRYRPWGGGIYGGYMNFELDNGRSYRVDRDFDKGTVNLYDESFNDITGAFTDIRNGSGIGEKLVGMGENLFERTVYINQMGTRIEGASSKDLVDRISNLRQSGTEDISVQKAYTVLREALKQQVGTDKSYTRPLDLINGRIEELNAAKSRNIEEKGRLAEQRINLENLDLELKKLEIKEELFTKLIEICELKKRNKVQLDKKEGINFLYNELKQSQKSINSMIKDKGILDQELAVDAAKLKELEYRQDQNSIGQNDLNDRGDYLRNNIRIFNICFILSLLIAAILVPGTFVFNEIKLWEAGLPAIAAVVLYILRIKYHGKLEELEEEREEIIKSNNRHKEEYESIKKIVLVLEQQLESLNNRITDEKAKYNQLTARLESISAQYIEADTEKLESEIDRVSEQIWKLRDTGEADLTKHEMGLLESTLEDNSDKNSIDLTAYSKHITDEIHHKKVEKAALEVTIQNSRGIENPDLMEEEISRLMVQKKMLEQMGEALSIAIKTLEEASNDVQKRYIPVMNKVFNGIFSGLTTQKYTDIRAGENLNIKLCDSKTDMVVPISMLSNGTIDQMYLALRIAISETIMKVNESLPFIMDEPFAQYDDERTDNALGYIYDISKKQQIIIFTCKQREVDMISSQYPCKICSLT